MDFSHDTAQLLDAFFAYGAVVVFQGIYFWLKFRGALHVPDRLRLWFLVSLGCLLAVLGLVLSILTFRVAPTTAEATVTGWKVSSVFSICCTEIFEVLYPLSYGRATHHTVYILWIGIAVQVAFVGPAVWLLVKHQTEILTAVPVASHITFVALTIYSLRFDNEVIPTGLAWFEVATGVFASVMSVGLNWVPHKVAAQCFLCMFIISYKMYRGADDGDDGDDDLDLALWDPSDNRAGSGPRDPSKHCAESGSCDSSGNRAESAYRHLEGRLKPTLEIHRECAIKQTSHQLPEDLFVKPGDDEKWERCFVQTSHFSMFQPVIESTPQLHAVGEIPDTQYFELAACQRWVQSSIDIGFPFLLASESGLQYDVSKPSQGEINVQGVLSASEIARRRFVRNAVDATFSGKHGQGLDDYYRVHTRDPRLLAPIKWACVLRDILVSQGSNPTIFRRFLQHLVFVVLHSFKDLEDTPAREVIQRKEDAWTERLRKLREGKTERPVDNPRAEMQLASLLQGVFESASDHISLSPQCFDMNLSAKDNLLHFRSLFSSYPHYDGQGEPVPMGSYEEARIRQALLQCRMYEDKVPELVGLQEQICKYVPVGFPDTGNLPADLVLRIPHGYVNAIRLQIARVYRDLPLLQKPENDMLILLCYYALSPADAATWKGKQQWNR
ncbi:hypothetical protein PGQ11_011246 [Apiospora arundinis]|uniref:Uncharacterized protein n=1 Tax=Apiospora arundinis TaxID=335852 RepID=A0ABR2HZ11_9PEZI